MTNEEKAKKIADNVFSSGLNTNRTFYDMAVTTAVELAGWKDSQPQIIEIFGKRVKIVEDGEVAHTCKNCAFDIECNKIFTMVSLCDNTNGNVDRHFVEVDEDGNEIKGGEQ